MEEGLFKRKLKKKKTTTKQRNKKKKKKKTHQPSKQTKITLKVIIIKAYASKKLNTAERSALYACTCWSGFGSRRYTFSVY